MTNEQAFAEFQYAVNHWFKFMDKETRENAARIVIEAIQLSPVGEVEYKQINHQFPIDYHAKKRDGRGAHFIGKVWMIHTVTRQKIRCTKEEVAAYQTKGFERGGARSK